MLFNLQNKWPVQEELEEGSDLGGAETEVVEPPAWATDIDDLRGVLSATESRLGERFAPINETLKGLQAAMAKQAVVEVSEDALKRLVDRFSKYDQTLGEGLADDLKAFLTGSVKQQAISAEALQPLLNPMFDEWDYKHAARWLDQVQETLQFSMDELRDPTLADKSAPKTETQKLFLKWYERQDTATRAALTSQREDRNVADPYGHGQALKAFNAYYKQAIQDSSKSAGAAASRLAGATQTRSAGRTNPTGAKLQTEEDGFMSVFKKAS
jgi:hypothetical protein